MDIEPILLATNGITDTIIIPAFGGAYVVIHTHISLDIVALCFLVMLNIVVNVIKEVEK